MEGDTASQSTASANNHISGFMHLAAGLSVGLTGLAAGYAIGIVGDVVRGPSCSMIMRVTKKVQGVRSYMQQSRIFVGMVLILIFGEVLGLYGHDELHARQKA